MYNWKFSRGAIIHHKNNKDNKVYICGRVFDVDNSEYLYLCSDDHGLEWSRADVLEIMWEQ